MPSNVMIPDGGNYVTTGPVLQNVPIDTSPAADRPNYIPPSAPPDVYNQPGGSVAASVAADQAALAAPPVVAAPAAPAAAPVATPVVTPAAAPSDAGSGGQGGFDFTAGITGDPGYQALLAALNSAQGADQANLARNTSSALVNFGSVPGGLPSSLPISDSDAALAAANPYSTTASLDREHQQVLKQAQNVLAARGGFSSGELPYAMQQEGYRYGSAENKATATLVDYLNGLQEAYATAQSNRELAKANGIADAYNRAVNLYAGSVGTSNSAGSGGADVTAAAPVTMVDTNSQAPTTTPAGLNPDGSYVSPEAAVAAGVPEALKYAAAGVDPSRLKVPLGNAYAF